MVETFRERPKQTAAKLTRNEHRAELLQTYRKAAQKNFKVEKEDFDNDLIISKLKKFMYK